MLIKIGADISELRSGMDKAVSTMQQTGTQIETAVGKIDSKLTGTLNNMGTQIKATALGFAGAEVILGTVQNAFHSLAEFVGDSVQSFAAAEASQRKLTAALEAGGRSTPAAIDQFNKLASQFQKTTVFSDDLITEMQALFVQVGNVGPAQMGAALKAATDLSAGLGIDLRAATLLVAKAFSGGGDELGRLKQILGDAYQPASGMAGILEAINQKFGGQAQAQMDTYSGRVQKLANDWDNFKEAVGRSIVDDQILSGILRSLTDRTSDLSDASESSASSITEMAVRVVGNSDALADWIGWMNAADQSASRLDHQVQGLIKSIKTPKGFQAEGMPFPAGYQKTIDDTLDSWTKEAEAQKKAAAAAAAHAKELANLRDELSGRGTIRAANDMLSVLKTMGPVQNLTAEAQKKINETVGRAIEAYTAQGSVVPDVLRTIYAETFHLTDTIPLVNKWADSFKQSNVDLADAAAGILYLHNVGTRAWPAMIDPLKIWSETLGKLPPAIDHTSDRISALAQSMAELGRAAGGAFGAVLSGAAAVVGSFGELSKANEKWQKEMARSTQRSNRSGTGARSPASRSPRSRRCRRSRTRCTTTCTKRLPNRTDSRSTTSTGCGSPPLMPVSRSTLRSITRRTRKSSTRSLRARSRSSRRTRIC
jgi:hypothetical protein